MSFQPHGKNLIAGNWVATETKFKSDPVSGPAQEFCMGTTDLVNRACEAAHAAFATYGWTSRVTRAAFLSAVAEQLETRTDDIVEVGTSETGLPDTRLRGELGRTTGQLRLFASHITAGDYLDQRHDPALPDRAPLPRPDLKMIQRPLGPVAVFGASNFPLAFSTAGGDTAAALAAGCPVVVKGHPAHPGTGEIVARAIAAAIEATGIDAGVFSFVHGEKEVGQTLVQHPLIRAVGFTGSLGAGRALFDLCAQREEPIPFFGELGSVNPMFLLPQAVATRGAQIGTDWAGSLLIGAGQFCTNPGIAAIPTGDAGDAVITACKTALEEAGAQTMLTSGIAAAYQKGRDEIAGHSAVKTILSTQSDTRTALPNLFETDAQSYMQDPSLGEEVFGPLGLVVRTKDADEMTTLAQGLGGQLTATLHMDDGDIDLARRLVPILETKAGRLLVNGFPTGVEVSDTMVHGGPYPASTNFGATSVGTLSIRRFLRPVCYQNMPDALLPAA